jgi:toxin YhaV
VSGRPFAERNGWRLFRRAEFRRGLDALAGDVDRLARQQPENWQSQPEAKLLRRIVDLIELEIPRDPNAPEYAQGNTLGPSHRHWRRTKFLRRFRLFFRFDSASLIIVYAWVNDENTLSKAGARTPYTVFRRKLDQGNPPDDWATLLAESRRAEDTEPAR